MARSAANSGGVIEHFSKTSSLQGQDTKLGEQLLVGECAVVVRDRSDHLTDDHQIGFLQLALSAQMTS
jgi:hypothetical protein